MLAGSGRCKQRASSDAGKWWGLEQQLHRDPLAIAGFLLHSERRSTVCPMALISHAVVDMGKLHSVASQRVAAGLRLGCESLTICRTRRCGRMCVTGRDGVGGGRKAVPHAHAMMHRSGKRREHHLNAWLHATMFSRRQASLVEGAVCNRLGVDDLTFPGGCRGPRLPQYRNSSIRNGRWAFSNRDFAQWPLNL
jgi:hypothetical protein